MEFFLECFLCNTTLIWELHQPGHGVTFSVFQEQDGSIVQVLFTVVLGNKGELTLFFLNCELIQNMSTKLSRKKSLSYFLVHAPFTKVQFCEHADTFNREIELADLKVLNKV